MPSVQLIEEKPISMAELKEDLKEIKKRDPELSFRTAKVSEALESVKVLKMKDAAEVIKAITKLEIPRVKEGHIVKIVDLLPTNVTELKNIFQSYTVTVTNENCEKVLEILAEYRK